MSTAACACTWRAASRCSTSRRAAIPDPDQRRHHRPPPDRVADGAHGLSRRPDRPAEPRRIRAGAVADDRRVRRHRREFAVLSIDLDRFKEVNDVFGHEVGDKLLIEARSRIQAPRRAQWSRGCPATSSA